MSEEVVLRKSDGLLYCPRCTVHYVNERAFRAHCKTKHGLKVTLFKKKSIEEKKAKARQRKPQRKATREALQAMAGKTFRLKQRALFTFAVTRIDDSTVLGAGRGLFANVDLSAGDICTVYDGEKVYEEPTDHEYACQLGVVTTKSWLMGLKDPVAGRGLGKSVQMVPPIPVHLRHILWHDDAEVEETPPSPPLLDYFMANTGGSPCEVDVIRTPNPSHAIPTHLRHILWPDTGEAAAPLSPPLHPLTDLVENVWEANHVGIDW
ncbi:hypothetical protein H257_06258 [Aphanomyces astaci]|uniref:Uncharacterized protein n=1 Tax=Aphanomyces astaci TaxID=112090 RepID=W4GM44_APHAT|nr:hypothetical protein H257_06258 [Aphanomyces astaci]ETV80775.1 hypothetical protein H257_06258 [Aphanomyces astaci]|eukprot:XP_009829722.1 hypothetical protein H257_06258 [Aphanomyces astaci]